MDNSHIVIFEGICTFCNAAVNFIIKRDKACVFLFTPIQSEFGQELLKKHQVYCTDIDTFALIKNEQCYIFSSAALEITKDLSGFWYLFTILKVIPAPIRDFFYKLFARNRYALFGKREQCMLPSEELKSRFIGL